MEYIYLLQREMDIKYNVFKPGMSTQFITKRLKASDYRRANVYLIRGVSNSKLAEQEIFKTLKELGYMQAKIIYPDSEFGDEDYVIKTNIYDVLDIINTICDKYKYLDQNIIINTEFKSSADSSSSSSSEIEIDSLDIDYSENECKSDIKIPEIIPVSNEPNENSNLKITRIDPNSKQIPALLKISDNNLKYMNQNETLQSNEKSK